MSGTFSIPVDGWYVNVPVSSNKLLLSSWRTIGKWEALSDATSLTDVEDADVKPIVPSEAFAKTWPSLPAELAGNERPLAVRLPVTVVLPVSVDTPSTWKVPITWTLSLLWPILIILSEALSASSDASKS